jgi:hypothetical protein
MNGLEGKRWTFIGRVACAGVLAVACDDPRAGPLPQGHDDAGPGSPADATTDAVDSGGPTACTDDTTGLPPTAVCILHISGRAIDENGNPLSGGTFVSACAAQCNPGHTDANGRFRIDVGLHLVPNIYAVQIHVRPENTAFYFPLPQGAAGPIIEMGDLRVLPMPASGPSLAIDRAGVPAQSVTSGDVTLDVGDGVYVRLDVESNVAGALGKQFRSLRIPDTMLHEFADPALGMSVLYALEPFESSFELASAPNMPINVRLAFANFANLAAGSAVDLLALRSYVHSDRIPPVTFQKAAAGHVSVDGKSITLDPGEGLPYLTWVGLRNTP